MRPKLGIAARALQADSVSKLRQRQSRIARYDLLETHCMVVVEEQIGSDGDGAEAGPMMTACGRRSEVLWGPRLLAITYFIHPLSTQ